MEASSSAPMRPVVSSVSGHCPGREPPFLAVKRPARPHRSTIQNQFTRENAEGA
jgi:hypothetical protein